MKTTSFIKALKQGLAKKSFAIIGMLVILTSLSFGAIQAEFYPDRPTYDYNTSTGRLGSTTGPVFNSFINTPSYGDERSFLDARRSDQTAAGSYKNVLPDVTDGSQEVVIRAYVHNNANPSLNGANFDGAGVAKNTKVKIVLPTATSNVMRARADISADNAVTVEDTVDFTGTSNFHLEYVKGSAILYNNGAFKSGTTLSDAIVDSGALIGYSALDGNFPGCFDYEATVQIRVKVVPNAVPGMNLTKEVRIKGDKTWSKEVSAKPGQNVEWLLTDNNTGNAKLDNIVLQDVLPPHVKLVPGSVRRINSNDTAYQTDAPLFDGGINVGSYNAGAGFYIMFETQTLGDFDACSIRVRNQAYAHSTQTTEIGDTADLVVTKDNCTTPVASYSCDLMSVSKSTVLQNEKFQTTVKYSAKDGAKFKIATFTFGDEKSDKDKLVVNASNNNTVVVDHAYADLGDRTVSVKLDFDVNGQIKSVEGGSCVAKLKVVAPTPLSCDLLSATISGNTITINKINVTPADATVNSVVIDFGNGTTKTITPSQLPYAYTYTTAKQYTIKATAKTSAGDVTSDKCSASITTASTPTSLPNTGAGSTIAVFLGTTLIGAYLYRMRVIRGLN